MVIYFYVSLLQLKISKLFELIFPFTPLLTSTVTNGAEIYYTAQAQDEGTCENTCQSTFTNPRGVSGGKQPPSFFIILFHHQRLFFSPLTSGFNGFVWVPYTASDAIANQAGNPYSAFTCWCKANIADASNQLVASSFRSCNLSGACSQYNGLITNAYCKFLFLITWYVQ